MAHSVWVSLSAWGWWRGWPSHFLVLERLDLDHLAGWGWLPGDSVGPWCWRRWPLPFASGLCTLCSHPKHEGVSPRNSAPWGPLMAAWRMSVFPSALSQGHLSVPLPTITATLNKVSSRKHFQEPVVSTNPDVFRLLDTHLHVSIAVSVVQGLAWGM